MADEKWVHADVINAACKYIDDLGGVTLEYWLVKAYADGDSYATVTGNKLAGVALAAGDIAASGGVLTVSAKSGLTASASSGAGPDNHLVLVDTATSKVLLVTDETTEQEVTSGNTVNLPSWTWTIAQPT